MIGLGSDKNNEIMKMKANSMVDTSTRVTAGSSPYVEREVWMGDQPPYSITFVAFHNI